MEGAAVGGSGAAETMRRINLFRVAQVGGLLLTGALLALLLVVPAPWEAQTAGAVLHSIGTAVRWQKGGPSQPAAYLANSARPLEDQAVDYDALIEASRARQAETERQFIAATSPRR